MSRTLEQDSRLQEKLRRELGPVVLGELQNPKTEDVLLNPDGMLWAKRAGEGFVELGSYIQQNAISAMGTIAAWHETVINYERPIVECELPVDGSRFEGLIRPVVSGPTFAIRTKAQRIYTLGEYSQAGITSTKDDPLNHHRRTSHSFVDEVKAAGLDHTGIIKKAIKEKKSILVVGATGSGKTTFANALLLEMAQVAPQDRILIIEDTLELQCDVRNHVQLKAFGNVTMLDCLKACMRLKPTRIVVGEVRGAEALTLLKSWNTGHPGGVATVHANDAQAGLKRLEALIAEATAAPSQTLIAEAVDLVVFIDEEARLTAGRKVREVMAVRGFDHTTMTYQVDYL